jgi:hypothetical protein
MIFLRPYPRTNEEQNGTELHGLQNIDRQFNAIAGVAG